MWWARAAPAPRGLRPGAGSVIAAIEAASGVSPLVIGKPQPLLFEEAARAVGADPASAIVIGDGLLTDIAAAHAVGARSVLMLTGVSTRAQAAALPVAQRPTAIASDAAELAAALDELAAAG